MSLPFCILKMRDDGSLHFVEEAESLDDARERVGALAELWPGVYLIHNEATGERISIVVGDTTN